MKAVWVIFYNQTVKLTPPEKGILNRGAALDYNWQLNKKE